MLPLTVLILTHNEAINIEPCLRALARVDDVVIVDSGSTDDTLARARAVRPDVRIFEHPFQDFGDQRNWAIDHAQPRHEWLLFVDADEYCDPELLNEIEALITNPADVVGGYIAGRNYFLGQWLKRSTMYPSFQLRLLKCGQVRYRKEGHGQREVTDGPLHYLKHGWRHEAFSKGVHQWVARHNQYSTDEVELVLRLRSETIPWRNMLGSDPIARRRALKILAARLPGRPLWRFLYTYVLRAGMLDGRAGLNYCLLRVAHDLHIGVKLRERRLAARAAR
ncbi:MAG: glycosyltransferase family 2 protein [Xanthomonadales bacterium]|nr:glycosyltransferase family 2 protein [Xanthomonadales bacterium]MCB1643499.1 glycosyltransferase family 2 protein [Xanthomonadales bacterium]